LRGGVTTFSAVLDAEEVVGRIMRARKLSSVTIGSFDRLCLDGCFLIVEVEGLLRAGLSFSFSLEGLRLSSALDAIDARPIRLGERDTALVDGARDCRPDVTALVATFESDEFVGAVSDAGSFTGLVGDLGFGLWNPVDGDV
jgi:hypothetical protein